MHMGANTRAAECAWRDSFLRWFVSRLCQGFVRRFTLRYDILVGGGNNGPHYPDLKMRVPTAPQLELASRRSMAMRWPSRPDLDLALLHLNRRELFGRPGIWRREGACFRLQPVSRDPAKAPARPPT